jgi:hypothetical protein
VESYEIARVIYDNKSIYEYELLDDSTVMVSLKRENNSTDSYEMEEFAWLLT